ncbi:MAG: MmcQ/YjbR family DNA-binding protein [Anaerolineae bacterium]|nr:MmcQ/YjbR family DNA-binding protein [Anaerolineae bacterium]
MNDESVLEKLRAICLALPEATEGEGVGQPTFRVRDKIFAMRHPHETRTSLWCKAPPGLQEALINSEPERFFRPPYVGQHGWIGIWLDVALDWEFIRHLITQSYQMTAPKRLIKLIANAAPSKPE